MPLDENLPKINVTPEIRKSLERAIWQEKLRKEARAVQGRMQAYDWSKSGYMDSPKGAPANPCVYNCRTPAKLLKALEDDLPLYEVKLIAEIRNNLAGHCQDFRIELIDDNGKVVSLLHGIAGPLELIPGQEPHRIPINIGSADYKRMLKYVME